MLGPEMNAGLDAGPIQKKCGAGSVPGPDLGKKLTSLLPTPEIIFSEDLGHFILEKT